MDVIISRTTIKQVINFYINIYIMNMSDSIIKMKGSLKQIQLENMLIQKIRKELCDSFVNLQDIKMNVDLIRQICCTIEKKRLIN
jgi:hypothetical protein